MAQFRIDQATPGAGVAGQSRHDLINGEVISLVATSPTGPGITYSWEIRDKVGSTAALTAATGISTTIGPAGGVVTPCAFLIRLTVDDNGSITTVERIATVRTANASLRIPLFSETSPVTNKLSANDPATSTDNAVYADLSGLGSAGQNWRGWAEWAYEVTKQIDANAAGGGGGGGNGSAGPVDDSQLGTTEKNIGSIYLESGSTLENTSRALIGGSLVGESCVLRLRRFTGGAQLASFTRNGVLADTAVDGGSPVAVSNTDWYDITIAATNPAHTAIVKGLRLVVT